ncbi:MAG: STAS domain-containing protein [Clostridia bacterium]|nr:STAS domain-containing protein [Clostridia bacterium]
MTIEMKKEKKSLTLKIAGRLDTTSAPEMEKAVKENIGSVEELVIDMENLEYISSAGLRVLLSAQKTMNGQGSVKVINVSDTIMEIFEITGFNEIMTIK